MAIRDLESRRIDEKEFLALHEDYHSEDFKKARRNLIITSFIVIANFILGISLREVKVLGIDLAETIHPKLVLGLALMLTFYWIGLVFVYLNRDEKIQSERENFLNKQVSYYQERLDSFYAKGTLTMQESSEKKDIETILFLHKEQKERIKSLKFWNNLIEFIDKYIPISMGILGVGILFSEIIWGK